MGLAFGYGMIYGAVIGCVLWSFLPFMQLPQIRWFGYEYLECFRVQSCGNHFFFLLKFMK